jgi:hypothetical protein
MVGRAGEDTSQLAGECDPDVRRLQAVGAIYVGQDDDVGAIKLKSVAGGAKQEAGHCGCGRHDHHHDIIEHERINGMHAECDERRQRLRSVVDAMELPQKWNFVAEIMVQSICEFVGQEHRNSLDRSGDQRRQIWRRSWAEDGDQRRAGPICNRREGQHRRTDFDAGRHRVEQAEAEVSARGRAEDQPAGKNGAAQEFEAGASATGSAAKRDGRGGDQQGGGKRQRREHRTGGKQHT